MRVDVLSGIQYTGPGISFYVEVVAPEGGLGYVQSHAPRETYEVPNWFGDLMRKWNETPWGINYSPTLVGWVKEVGHRV